MSAPLDADLRAALEQALRGHLGRPAGITRLRRRPSPYRTSFPLEEMDVLLADGTELAMVFKDLSRRGLTPEAHAAKPPFLHDPLREIEAYRAILGPARLGAPICYGAVTDGNAGQYWLFLERVAGRELYQVGELALWRHAASWLASLHSRFVGTAERLMHQAPLLRHDAGFYRLWLDRAVRFLQGTPMPEAARRGLARLADRYDEILGRLAALPATFLHGEFYASNVLVQETPAGPRVCPVDWELAAVGPGLMDMAALTAGKWGDGERRELALAYWSALSEGGRERLAFADMLPLLDCCRLQVAVQWLGWSPAWSPPPEHSHDWLGEALSLAERLLD